MRKVGSRDRNRNKIFIIVVLINGGIKDVIQMCLVELID